MNKVNQTVDNVFSRSIGFGRGMASRNASKSPTTKQTTVANSGVQSPKQGGALGAKLMSSSDRVVTDLALEAVGTMPGSVVPNGFTHYSHCTCFKPNKNYPNYTLEHAELEMYTE